MSARKSSHRTIFLIVSSGSPLALIASTLRSTSKKPVCPMTRSLHPPMAHCRQRVRFAATWREEFFEVPSNLTSDGADSGYRPLTHLDSREDSTMTTTPALWRSGFRDNANLPGSQDRADVAPTIDDQFFAVWIDTTNFNGGVDTIVARKFDSNGDPQTGDIPLPLGTNLVDADFPTAVRLPIAGQGDGLAVAFQSHAN